MMINKYALFNGIILTAFSLSLLSEFTDGIFKVGFLDEIGILLIILLSTGFLLSKKTISIYNQDFVLLFLLLILIYVLFYVRTLLSFSYELYKVTVFSIFIPIIKGFPRDEINNLVKKVIKLINFFLKLNLFAIGLQYVFGRDILKYIGYSDLRLYGSEGAGRLSGFISIGTLGYTALLLILLNEIFNKESSKYSKILLVAGISVILSTSKISYIILLAWIVIKYWSKIHKYLLKILIAMVVIITTAFYFAKDAIYSKITQYSFLLENLHKPEIINLGIVEKRAMFMARSISIFRENIFGLGFGTFGDASSKYNPDHYKMSAKYWTERSVFMSDSSFSHMLAEQGITYFVLLFLLFLPYFKIQKTHKKYFLMLYVLYISASFVNMGLSSGNWPIFFAFIYAILYYSKRYEQKEEQ